MNKWVVDKEQFADSKEGSEWSLTEGFPERGDSVTNPRSNEGLLWEYFNPFKI